MSEATDEVRKRYDRIAPLYDLLERPMEAKFSQWRDELLQAAEGRVLEVGVGTGKNRSPDRPWIFSIPFRFISTART
jgi:ubiquinone/menaquinone biosynthesis C-methylase UbiE